MTRRDPSPWFVFAVLFLVYIGWGSSYIGYKLSLEVAGPFLVAGGRAFIGGLLLAFMLLASGKWVRPSWKTIRWNLVVGIPFVLFGSGFIGFGQTQVSSSTAAVITSTTPILMLVAGYLFAGEPRPAFLQWVGLIAGSAGITYIGLDTILSKRVAIKEFYPSGAANRTEAVATAIRKQLIRL